MEAVTVPAGTFDTFRVELTPTDGGPDQETLWIAKDSRTAVKKRDHTLDFTQKRNPGSDCAIGTAHRAKWESLDLRLKDYKRAEERAKPS